LNEHLEKKADLWYNQYAATETAVSENAPIAAYFTGKVRHGIKILRQLHKRRN
jgi:hypothetical protein